MFETTEATSVTKSSGNVFADLALADPELLLLKADVAIALERALRSYPGSQAHAAAAAGLTQPQISRLARGDAMGFTIDRLLRSLFRLGYQIDLQITPPRDDGERA